jgi:mycofactocin system glycosyltransferase
MVADPSLRRVAPGSWVGGSPLRLFRLRGRGDDVAAALVAARDGVATGALRGTAATTAAEGRLLERLAAAGAAHPLANLGAGPPAGEVAVVVPVRDDADGLGRLLGTLPERVREVVVVDDGSAPAEADRVRRCASEHGARVVRHERPRGPGAARNTGVAACAGAYVAFLDADVELAGDWLPHLLAHFARPCVAMVAPRVRSIDGPGLLAAYERRRSPLDLGGERARVAPGTRVSYVPSAALVVDREVLEQLGGFEPGLSHGEDVDLVWRAVAAGHEVRYEPFVEVWHRPRPTWAAWVRQRVGYGTSAAALDQRHPHQVAPAVMSPWSAALWLLVGLGRPVAAAVLGGATAAVPQRRLHAVPRDEVARLVLGGHLGAGRQLARAVIRVWWPLLVAAAPVSRRVRRVGVACLLVHVATTDGPWWCRAVAVLDDAAYGAGVWRGAWRRRDPRVLAPRLTRRAPS